MRQETQFQTSFCFIKKALYEVKTSGLQLSFNHFRQFSAWQTINTKYIKLQNIDPEICSILIFQKRVWKQCLHYTSCIIFQEKYFSGYILLTGQVSFPGRLCFLRYWLICVLQLFVNQVATSQVLKLALSF